MEAGLREKLADDLKQSLRNRDRLRCSVIRLLMAAVRNTEIARQATLDDSGILGVIVKEIKQREESIGAYKAGNRPDLVAQEEAEMAMLKGYLPEQASREEIIEIARRVIRETGAKGPHDKGKVMPRIIAELRGKADGCEINAVVAELLAS
ncbi:MAG: GatB/YqeY domain-containing protein [Chloroflexota bacterium]